MTKKGRKRGKRGGTKVFLKGLKRELSQVREFDPNIAFASVPLPELAAPREIVPHRAQLVAQPTKLPRRQTPVSRRVARAIDTFVPMRIPTRPLPPSVYARRPPSSKPSTLRIRHNVPVAYKIIVKPSGHIVFKNLQNKNFY
jgi:hypothetical protein